MKKHNRKRPILIARMTVCALLIFNVFCSEIQVPFAAVYRSQRAFSTHTVLWRTIICVAIRPTLICRLHSVPVDITDMIRCNYYYYTHHYHNNTRKSQRFFTCCNGVVNIDVAKNALQQNFIVNT